MVFAGVSPEEIHETSRDSKIGLPSDDCCGLEVSGVQVVRTNSKAY